MIIVILIGTKSKVDNKGNAYYYNNVVTLTYYLPMNENLIPDEMPVTLHR